MRFTSHSAALLAFFGLVLLLTACPAASSQEDDDNNAGLNNSSNNDKNNDELNDNTAPDNNTPDLPDAAEDAPAAEDAAQADAAPEDAAPGEDVSAADAPPAEDAPDAAQPDAQADTGEEASCALPPPAVASLEAERSGRYDIFRGVPASGLPDRDVVVYLPRGYDASQARYPVLYMHDGQNLFHDTAAAFGTAWEVDDTLDRLTDAGQVPPWIVVAIDNTALRLDEYTPDVDPEYGGGRGAAYGALVVERIKPLIDARYRTWCDRAHTAVAGSSLGGLISLDLALRYPAIFGRVAAVSPSLWWNDRSMVTRIDADDLALLPTRLWLDAGTAEGSITPEGVTTTVLNAAQVRDRALARGASYASDLAYLEVIDGEHNEAAWEARLPDLFTFLLADTPTSALPVTALELHLYRPRLAVGGRSQLNVLATHGGRATLSWPPALASVTFDPPGVAELRGDALVGLAPGTTTVTARVGGRSASTTLTVTGGAATVEVRLTVQVPNGTDQVWISGDLPQLGEWDGAGVQLAPIDLDVWSVTLDLPPGTPFLYKYTRGGWDRVEKRADGSEAADRAGNSGASGAVLEDSVPRWADSP